MEVEEDELVESDDDMAFIDTSHLQHSDITLAGIMRTEPYVMLCTVEEAGKVVGNNHIEIPEGPNPRRDVLRAIC